MLGRLLDRIDGILFDALMAATLPPLIWWVNHGLSRDDLAEELREFQSMLDDEDAV